MLNPRPTYEEFRKEIKAHAITLSRIKHGFIKRPKECEECGKKGKIDSHHPNYDIPNLIKWLCRKCHGKHRRDKVAQIGHKKTIQC